MRRRRRWLAWTLAILGLALAVRWLLAPADRDSVIRSAGSSSATGGSTGLASPGRRHRRSRLDELVAWVRRQFEEQLAPDPPPTPFEPLPALGPPGTLAVVVREEGGAPIAGASVVLFGPRGVPAVSARTSDVEGRVVFPGLPSGPGYEVRATIPETTSWGEDPGRRRTDVRAGETSELVLERPSLRIEGVVRDATTGEPVAGADVEAMNVAGELEARARDPRVAWTAMAFGGAEPAPRVSSTVTGPDGRFRLDAGALASVELRARAPDGRAGDRLVSRGEARVRRDLSVCASRRCVGTVVDGEGRPQGGLQVSIPSWSSNDAPAVTTGAQGRFSLPVSGEGSSVRVVVSGASAPRFSVTIPVDRDARIVVPGSAVLDVRLVEEGTGRPLAGAHLVASVGTMTTEATADDEGRARIATSGGPISTVRVFATSLRAIDLASDYEDSALVEPADAFQRPLLAGETRSVTVRARPGAIVVGRVLHPDGSPAAHVRVHLTTGWNGPVPSGLSGADGRFAIAGCVAPPPSWTRGVHADGDARGEGSFEAEVPTNAAALARGTIDLGDVRLRRGAVVRARVVDPGGASIPEASASGNVAARADAEGWLVLAVGADQLTPRGTIAFDVAAPGFRTREVRCSTALAEGEVRDLPPIRLERGTRVVARVLDADGRPVPGSTVRWAWNGDTTPVRTDTEGRAILSGAPSDAESVEVTLPDGARFVRYGPLPPAAGDRIDLDLRLPPTRTIAVQVKDTDGRPVALASLSAARTPSSSSTLGAEERWSAVDATGLARLTSVVAVPVRLRSHATGFVTQEVSADATATSVTVTLEAIGDASSRRLGDVLASLESLDRELRTQDPDDDGEEARARFHRRQELQAERERLQGR